MGMKFSIMLTPTYFPCIMVTECHATGTEVGDIIELQALGEFFKVSVKNT